MKILKTTLLFVFAFPVTLIYSQTNKKTFAKSIIFLGDSLSPKKGALKRWQPYIGLHVSGDAGMYYIGPSFQAGSDYYLKKRLLLSFYLHYFGDKLRKTGSNGFFEKGKYRTLTSAILLQTNTAKKNNGRSFFIGAGVSVQYRRDTALTSYAIWDDKRTSFTPVCRLGYYFPLGKHKWTIELNATGPYSSGDTNYSVIEILTQVSLGCRYVF